jgi:excisionase family DNA binding protein
MFTNVTPRLLSVNEVATLLSLHPHSVYRKIHSGEMAAVSTGRGRRVEGAGRRARALPGRASPRSREEPQKMTDETTDLIERLEEAKRELEELREAEDQHQPQPPRDPEQGFAEGLRDALAKAQSKWITFGGSDAA